jgi:hypothetical protein
VRPGASAALILAGLCCPFAGCDPEGDSVPAPDAAEAVDAAAVADAADAADASQASPRFHFVEVAAQAGLDAISWCGRPDKPHILESNGTGLALLDHDLDGDLDVYLVNAWRLEGDQVVERGRDRLYANRGDGTFDDVTEAAGLGWQGWGCGVAVGDADGNGYPDLFVTNFGPDVLALNQGDGTFRLADDPPGLAGWSAGAAFFDADADGDEDLFVSAYLASDMQGVLDAEPTLRWNGQQVMLGPFGLEGEANAYFENLGDGRFDVATEAAGLVDLGLYFSFAVVAADLDGDLDTDLYVANDSNPNYLYRNDGAGHFDEVGLWSGAAMNARGAAQAGMGAAAGDLDADGLLDLFVTNFAEDGSTLYRNLGDCLFDDETSRANLLQATYASLSWGTAFCDLDLDGQLELVVVNGHIYPQADVVLEDGLGYAQPNLLLAGDGERFVDVSAEAGPGFAELGSSRGLAVGDLDGDGDLDLLVANVDAPPSLLRNDSPRRGSWLLVDAPGVVRVTAIAGERRWVRHAVRGGSYLSASDPRLHFGLGSVERVERLELLWPDGQLTSLSGVDVDRVVRVERPD